MLFELAKVNTFSTCSHTYSNIFRFIFINGSHRKLWWRPQWSEQKQQEHSASFGVQNPLFLLCPYRSSLVNVKSSFLSMLTGVSDSSYSTLSRKNFKQYLHPSWKLFIDILHSGYPVKPINILFQGHQVTNGNPI